VNSLFDQFPSTSASEWLNQVKKDLKSEDPHRQIHSIIEGIEIPVYFDKSQISSAFPLANRSAHHPEYAFANDWEKRVNIETDDLKLANKRALQSLEHGATSIGFTGHEISNQEELRLVLKGIQCDIAAIHFDCDEATPSLLFMFVDELIRMKIDLQKVNGSLGWDPLGRFVFKGNFEYSREESMQLTASLIQFAEPQIPNYKCITVKGVDFHNAGATAVQELASVLSISAEYLDALENHVSKESVAKTIQWQLAAGENFFLQIAKIRAARLLWEMLLHGNDLKISEFPIWIQTETAFRNKTRYDAHSNLLRCTTESMAAVIAGTDEHMVHPFNAHFDQADDAARRYALNIQHVLNEESRLDKVLDPSSGAPYIEFLTQKIVEQAWSLFLKMEEKGGFVASARAGFLQDAILSNRASIEKNMRTRKQIMVGINQFADASEISQIEPILQRDPLDKLPEIKTLDPYFEAASFESLRRLYTLEGSPNVYLLVFGDPAKRKARAGFAADFMASAGFISHYGDASVAPVDQLHSEAAKKSDVVVLCAADEDYELAVAQLNSAGWPDVPVVIAGNPANSNDLKAAGVSDFIYMGCDAISVFHNLLEAHI
jgi:methylmalonyl-CoA mutase